MAGIMRERFVEVTTDLLASHDRLSLVTADLSAKLFDDARAALSGWLQKLAENRLDGIREHMPRYADVEVDDAGHVRSARLGRFGAGERFV